MQASYFIPEETLGNFMKDGAMNWQYGIQFYGLTNTEKARKMLPPPLEAVEQDGETVFYAYIVNIREPTFAPWYMEGGIGIMARLGDQVGLYFLGLQLSGPGALMGAFSGREGSGLPKQLCDRIVVHRTGNKGHCVIERKGVRLIDIELDIGQYNDPSFSQPQEGCSRENPIITEGGCLLHKYRMSSNGFSDMEIVYYDSPSRFYSWEPATAKITLQSSIDDPWGEVVIDKVLGAGWMVSDNMVSGVNTIYRYDDPTDITRAMQNLFAGRYDQCTLCSEHQQYE
jgi:acetoacetate decarboxylase